MSDEKILRIGMIGSGFISQVHYDSFQKVRGCQVVAQADINGKNMKDFQVVRPIQDSHTDIDEMLARPDIDLVTVAVPNTFHYHWARQALLAGKHLIVEKPLTVTLEQAMDLLSLAKERGLVIGYAEELCYIPKFIRMKQIAQTGGIGKVYMVKQCEKHAGPYSPWFWQREGAGGGILMDMGCHAIEFCRWFMGKKKVAKVTAHMGTYLHGKVTQLEDHVILTMEFEDGTLGQVESSWALKGGMDSVAEVYGTGGVLYGDLLRGMGIKCFSETGYLPQPGNQAQDGGPDSAGWSMPDYEWLWNNGYPQEMQDFVDAVRLGRTPVESGTDGLAVLEIMLAGYYSAGIGATVSLPFKPRGVEFPVDLWKNPPKHLEFFD